MTGVRTSSGGVTTLTLTGTTKSTELSSIVGLEAGEVTDNTDEVELGSNVVIRFANANAILSVDKAIDTLFNLAGTSFIEGEGNIEGGSGSSLYLAHKPVGTIEPTAIFISGVVNFDVAGFAISSESPMSIEGDFTIRNETRGSFAIVKGFQRNHIDIAESDLLDVTIDNAGKNVNLNNKSFRFNGCRIIYKSSASTGNFTAQLSQIFFPSDFDTVNTSRFVYHYVPIRSTANFNDVVFENSANDLVITMPSSFTKGLFSVGLAGAVSTGIKKISQVKFHNFIYYGLVSGNAYTAEPTTIEKYALTGETGGTVQTGENSSSFFIFMNLRVTEFTASGVKTEESHYFNGSFAVTFAYEYGIRLKGIPLNLSELLASFNVIGVLVTDDRYTLTKTEVDALTEVSSMSNIFDVVNRLKPANESYPSYSELIVEILDDILVFKDNVTLSLDGSNSSPITINTTSNVISLKSNSLAPSIIDGNSITKIKLKELYLNSTHSLFDGIFIDGDVRLGAVQNLPDDTEVNGTVIITREGTYNFSICNIAVIRNESDGEVTVTAPRNSNVVYESTGSGTFANTNGTITTALPSDTTSVKVYANKADAQGEINVVEDLIITNSEATFHYLSNKNTIIFIVVTSQTNYSITSYNLITGDNVIDLSRNTEGEIATSQDIGRLINAISSINTGL